MTTQHRDHVVLLSEEEDQDLLGDRIAEALTKSIDEEAQELAAGEEDVISRLRRLHPDWSKHEVNLAAILEIEAALDILDN